MVECDPNTCPAGEKCENQYFEKRIYPSLAPCFTDGRGWGLKLLEDIPKGMRMSMIMLSLLSHERMLICVFLF